MKRLNICVIGGAGFIGSHVVNKLLTLGHEVFVVDTLDPQVHGEDCEKEYVHGAPIVKGDLEDGSYAWNWISGNDVVIHLAASVGVGQSMHRMADYVDNNSRKTARLLDALNQRLAPKRLVVASSMSIYGEGETLSSDQGDSKWKSEPVPTPETTPPDLRSVYALTKYDQEQLCLIWGKAYDVPTVALRFFNTYGPGQSLNNPYTGVLAIFASRLLNDKPPVIYEDGQQTRDFIHVDDVANAVVHAATTDMPSGAYNVGTGMATSIRSVAEEMIHGLLPSKMCNVHPVITGEHRKGDIRHCFADIAKIKATGWEPKIPFTEGLMEYCAWLRTQPKPEDKFEQAHQELVANGLTR